MMRLEMKGTYMKTLILGLFLISSVASAARLEDVNILSVTPGRDNFELKLQVKDGPKDSFFYVDITKSDPDSFDKLGHIIKKMMKRSKHQLNLDIPSFSVSPSGSYYKSDGITFYETTDREPDSVKAKKNKK